MRIHLLVFFTALASIAPLAPAQVSLEMEPIEADSIITDITLYRGRAAITRTATLDLSSGGYSVFFRDLPATAYLDSVQASVSDNVRLLSIDTSSKPIAKDNSNIIQDIRTAIDIAEAKLNVLNAREESIKVQISLLKTLINHGENDKKETVDLSALQEQLDFVGTNMNSLISEQIDTQKEQSELEQEIKTLQRRLSNLGSSSRTQRDAVVDIGVTKAGTITVQLTYLVNNATWNPVYSIRANNEGSLITVEYDAEIQQRTGENWTDVNMTLSTSQPQQSTTPPMPNPWYVDVYVPTPPSIPRAEMRMARGSKDALLDTMELNMAVESASANATVNTNGPAVSFSLPRTITMPSNAEDVQTTALGAFETEAELFRIAVPMITDRTYIRSQVTNTSEYILLPGKASIFHGSDYVGKTSLSTIAPGESFPLDLGIDPVVTASRILLEKETTTTGLFGSGTQTNYQYRVTISNGHDEAIDIRVWDRIPISRNEEIEVTLQNLSIPLSTATNYLTADRPQGLLRWDLSLPANTTADNSVELRWHVEVARGNDVEMTPLPE
ncbi:MAG: mucoidy inhibitor MuiA family protein [Phycisphaerae bacterium]|nr:mucoidy inhibitor MuiA family protein [Phycisphaerae bacterium]